MSEASPLRDADRVGEGRTATLRFLFVKTLRRPYLPDAIPFPKQHNRLRTVLSREEVSRLIDSAGNLHWHNLHGKRRPLPFAAPSFAVNDAVLATNHVRDARRMIEVFRSSRSAAVQ